MITEVLLLLLIGLLTKMVWTRKKRQRCFKDLGIPGPEPNLFLGNQLDLIDGPAAAMKKWTEQYGQTFGYFEGLVPILVTSDLEIIKHVFIRKFSHFMARKPLPFGPDPEGKEFNSVFLARGQTWKRYRSFMSPMFSTNKLKATTPLVTKGLDILMELFEEKCKEGKPFDVLPYYQGLTMQVICSTAFGMDVDAQREPDNEFVVNTKAMFKQQNFRSEPLYRKMMVYIAVMFPALGSLMFKSFLYLFLFGIIKFEGFLLAKRLEEIIEERRAAKLRGEPGKKDFLQYMLDAEVEEVHDLNTLTIPHEDADDAIETSGSRPNLRKVKELAKDEVIGNLNLFHNAGFETTSTALSYASYELALNPQVQARLQEELDEQLGENHVTYDDLANLPYLHMTFHEVLRKHPIAPSLVTRCCMEETEVCGLKIPKGMSIVANVEDIHYDPEVWGPTDPDLLDPERFSSDEQATRHPVAFLTFGIGPRNCVGMRLAQVEGKMALARILQKFSFEKCDETEVPLKKMEQLTVVPENGVKIRLVERDY